MRIKDYIAKNQIYALLAKGVDGVKIITINIIIARMLGPEIYGKFAYVIGVISILAIIAEFRLQAILVKELAVAERSGRSVLLSNAFAINVVFSLFGTMLGLFYFLIETDEVLGLAIFLASLSYIFNIPRFLRAFYISQEKNVLIAKSELFASLITIAIVVVAVTRQIEWQYLPVLRLMDYMYVSMFFLMFFYYYHSEKIIFKSVNIKKSISLIKKSSPLVLSGVAMILFQRMDLIMIRNILTDVDVGYYSAAANYMMLFSLAPMVVSESLGPKIFRGSKGRDEKKKFILFIMAFGLLMSILMLITGIYLIPFLYGSQYTNSILPHLALSLCPFLVASGAAAGQLIVSDETQGRAYWKSVWACVINFILNLVLIPVYGIFGAALATVVGFFVANILGHWFVKEYRYIFYIQINFFLPWRLGFK